MKKIAFILALVLCFSVVLASCEDTQGNESTPADASSEAPAESVPADESIPADESVPAEESENDFVAPAEVANLVSGKEYTTAKLYAQNSEWLYDETCAPAYPDESGKDLTDGVFEPAEASFQDPVWVGLHGGTPDALEVGYTWVTFDLGEVKAVTEVKAYTGTLALTAGINAPDTASVAVSDNGTDWVEVGSVNVTDDETNPYVVITIPVNVNTQYVQVRLVNPAAWVFVSEVEVIGG